ncbi:hypothetical protein [Candidatus Aalborgicola defluviihabitans]|uniref:hypothetical protein n=1 Tax=Candidatus Aalborgicola defluviihabitans TaxID=3386187 RepID=UPI001DB08831|nr:hypothetical protein [Burkholderiales bacterium]
MVADNQMRYRDERFAEQDKYKGKPDPLSEKATGANRNPTLWPQGLQLNINNTATCPAVQLMTSAGKIYLSSRGLHFQTTTAKEIDYNACALSGQYLKTDE